MTRRRRKYLTASKLENKPHSRETFSLCESFGIDSKGTAVLSVTPLIALSLSSVADQLTFQCEKTDLCSVELSSVARQPHAVGICFLNSLTNTSCFSRSIVA